MKKKIVLLLVLILMFGCAGGSTVDEPPNEFTRIVNGRGYFYLYGPITSSAEFVAAFRYFDKHNLKNVVIEIHSPGGYLHSAQRMIGIMDIYKKKIMIETRTFGVASSAGLLIFINGDIRLMSKDSSYLFWHQPQVGGSNPYTVLTPAQEQMKQILQEWMDQYIADRCKLLAERIKQEVSDDIWVIMADEAIKLGLADGYIEDII